MCALTQRHRWSWARVAGVGILSLTLIGLLAPGGHVATVIAQANFPDELRSQNDGPPPFRYFLPGGRSAGRADLELGIARVTFGPGMRSRRTSMSAERKTEIRLLAGIGSL